MPAMYKDAKEWLSENFDNISQDQIRSFMLSYLSNEDIETWFGLNMESNDDNPGAETCPKCNRESYDNELCDWCLEYCPVCSLPARNEDELEHLSNYDICARCLEKQELAIEFWAEFFESLNDYIDGF